MNLNLQEFLEKSSQLYCNVCEKKIFDNNINYCGSCKLFLDSLCAEYHKGFSHIMFNQMEISLIFVLSTKINLCLDAWNAINPCVVFVI